MKERRGWIIPYGAAHEKQIRAAVAAGGVVAAAVWGALYTECDSYGCFRADPATLAMDLPALMLTDDQAAAAIAALEGERLIVTYQVDGETYGQIADWDKQQPQQILRNRGSGSYPRPPGPSGPPAKVIEIPKKESQAPGNGQPGSPPLLDESCTGTALPQDLNSISAAQEQHLSSTSPALVQHLSSGSAGPVHPQDSGLRTPDSGRESRESSSSPEGHENLAAHARTHDDDDLSPSAPDPEAPASGRPIPADHMHQVIELSRLLEAPGGPEGPLCMIMAGELLAAADRRAPGKGYQMAAAAIERATQGGKRAVGSSAYLLKALGTVLALAADGAPAKQPVREIPPADDPADQADAQLQKNRRLGAAAFLRTELLLASEIGDLAPDGVPKRPWMIDWLRGRAVWLDDPHRSTVDAALVRVELMREKGFAVPSWAADGDPERAQAP